MRVADQPVPTVADPHEPLGYWPADVTVAIERVSVDAYAWDDFAATWDDAAYVWDAPAVATVDHVDATCDLHGLTVTVGAPDPEGRMEAGGAAFTLDNRDGTWSQYDQFGRLVDWLIGRQVAIWADHGGEAWWLFRGEVTAWREQADGTVDVEAFDAFTRLQANIGAWTPGVEGERPAARLEAICTLAGYSGPRRFDAGDVTLRRALTDRSVLEEMQQVALSDGGVLVVDADGTLTYRNRAWPGGRADQTDVDRFTDNVCGEAAVTVWDAVLSTDDDNMTNRAALTNDATPTPVAVTATNQPSIDLYGPKTLPEARTEDQWVTAAEGQALADFLVARRGDAYLRIESFALHLHDPRADRWAAGLNLRLGDVIEFLHEQPAAGGPQLVDLYLAVAAIEHTVTFTPPAWTVTVGTTRVVGNRVSERWDITPYPWDDPNPANVWGGTDVATTIGGLTNVPNPGEPVRSPWAQDVTKLAVHIFATKAALDGWAAADGAHARVTADQRDYVRIGGVWCRNPDYGVRSGTGDANGRLVAIPHLVGKVPSAIVATPNVGGAGSMVVVETLTATTFQLRFFTNLGGNPGAVNLQAHWIAYP